MFARRALDLVLSLVLVLAPILAIDAGLVTRPEPWLAFAFGALLLRTQPPVGPRRMVRDRGDRYSAAMIFATVIACFECALVEFALRERSGADGIAATRLLAGGALIAAGLGLRVWSIRTLGRWFTPTVAVDASQPIVEHGPYAKFRHPSYVGTILGLVGLCIALWSVAGAVGAALLVAPAYVYRVRVEERALRAHFGERYDAYRRRTWGLFPFLR